MEKMLTFVVFLLKREKAKTKLWIDNEVNYRNWLDSNV